MRRDSGPANARLRAWRWWPRRSPLAEQIGPYGLVHRALTVAALAWSDRGTAAAALGLDPTLKVAAAIGDSAADLEAARPLSGVAPPAQGGDGGAEQFGGFGDGKQLIVVYGVSFRWLIEWQVSSLVHACRGRDSDSGSSNRVPFVTVVGDRRWLLPLVAHPTARLM